ncbi:uncharacterized protein CIMG_05893 [Coccidioides immitis RS]|uniref:Uncharacterized protein n=1 Tax=Coccidioides immitis (strain RS) TaxID=246410 RepID=J3K704_COCIM|nr:uncharacterized protein CIMG_05893 [Coccidioides immitis RS]EAS30414.3 hypothetical protein CIMG_05893 [Coccidioides immitis RS]
MPPNSAALQTDLQPSSSQCRDLGQPKKFSTMATQQARRKTPKPAEELAGAKPRHAASATLREQRFSSLGPRLSGFGDALTVTGLAFWSSLALAPTDARIGQAFSLLWRLGESNHARRPITAARTLPHLESTASVALP